MHGEGIYTYLGLPGGPRGRADGSRGSFKSTGADPSGMLSQVSKAMDLLDRPDADGESVRAAVSGGDVSASVTTIESDEGSTDFLSVTIPGTDDDAPTLGVVGRLGGVGARPEEIGLVSDADGAIVAVAAAMRLAEMAARGDRLPGDVVVATHVCPDAPILPNDPVPFMTSPVSIATMNEHEVDERMDAVLSIDATKGNRVHCERGFAITPTVKEGWLLPVSDDLLDVQERVTGQPPSTLTLSTQDLTPYATGLDHINSIVQPATDTNAPVVGVGTTSVNPVAGSATGATYPTELAETAGFVVETAKDYTRGRASFYDPDEFDELVDRYGSMNHFQTLGDPDA